MNVRFMLNFPNPQRPILNLVVNEMIPLVNDGYAHLELRYNNNGSQGRLVPGLVSFKLGSYSPENSELKGLKVLVRPVGGEEKHISSLTRLLTRVRLILIFWIWRN